MESEDGPIPCSGHSMADITDEQRQIALSAVNLAGTWIAGYIAARAEHMKWAHPDEGPCPPFCQDATLIGMLSSLSESSIAMGQVLTVALDYIFDINRQIELARVVEGRS